MQEGFGYIEDIVQAPDEELAEIEGFDEAVAAELMRRAEAFIEKRDAELDENSVCRDFRHTAEDGKTYQTKYYNLRAITAVGYRVNSQRAIEFRKWATEILHEYIIKGFAMDDERLKNDGTILGKKYFEEQLQRIREIRLSERKFYQKITDIYAQCSIDYDVKSNASIEFYKTVQNKLHWAITGQTAAELIGDKSLSNFADFSNAIL